MEPWVIITIALAVIAVLIIAVAYFCFNDRDEDQFWYDNYQAAERPHIALKCKHTGKKTLVTEWTACGCEKVNTHCHDCGELIKSGYVDC